MNDATAVNDVHATGLPEVREGEFWRVEFPDYSNHAYLRLMICRGTGYFRDEERVATKLIDDGLLSFLVRGDLLPKHKVKPRHIRNAARKILADREKADRINGLSGAATAAYAGDYPPRTLGR